MRGREEEEERRRGGRKQKLLLPSLPPTSSGEGGDFSLRRRGGPASKKWRKGEQSRRLFELTKTEVQGPKGRAEYLPDPLEGQTAAVPPPSLSDRTGGPE